MIDLTDIKQLPDEEKWKIIEEIEASMDITPQTGELADPEYENNLSQVLSERLTAYKKGELTSFTWQEVKEKLQDVRQTLHTQTNT